MANYKLRGKIRNKKIIVAATVDEISVKLAKKFIDDDRVLINSFSQYVNIALNNLNNLNLKKYE